MICSFNLCHQNQVVFKNFRIKYKWLKWILGLLIYITIILSKNILFLSFMRPIYKRKQKVKVLMAKLLTLIFKLSFIVKYITVVCFPTDKIWCFFLHLSYAFKTNVIYKKVASNCTSKTLTKTNTSGREIMHFFLLQICCRIVL